MVLAVEEGEFPPIVDFERREQHNDPIWTFEAAFRAVQKIDAVVKVIDPRAAISCA